MLGVGRWLLLAAAAGVAAALGAASPHEFLRTDTKKTIAFRGGRYSVLEESTRTTLGRGEPPAPRLHARQLAVHAAAVMPAVGTTTTGVGIVGRTLNFLAWAAGEMEAKERLMGPLLYDDADFCL